MTDIIQGHVDLLRSGGNLSYVLLPNGDQSKTILRFEGGQFGETDGSCDKEGFNIVIQGFWELCDLRDALDNIIKVHSLDRA